MHLVVNAVPIRPGGGLTVLQGILAGLKQENSNGLQSTVVCSATDTRESLESSSAADRVVQVCADRGVLARQMWQTLQLGKLVKEVGADLLLGINFYANRVSCPQVVYHLDLCRFLPIPENLPFSATLAEMSRNRLALRALRYAEANVFESSFLRQTAETFVPVSKSRNRVIYIGLPDEAAAQAQLTDEATISQPSPHIVAVTNPLDYKDNPTLLRTLAVLVRSMPQTPWRLEIAGGLDANAWEPHQKLAHELGIADRVTWHGYLRQPQLAVLLNRCLCLVSTSRIESFCMVALEAMARHCPPIVADTTSMPESVGSAGVLVPAGDHEGFASAVRELYESRSRRNELVRQGVAHVQRHRWSDCGRQFHQLFAELAG
jgi:glycosyltransferase involved in cell wall biosynthesis